MKQQLPLLEPHMDQSPEIKKTFTLREDINLINYPSELKNINYITHKYLRKSTKFSVDSKESKIILNKIHSTNYVLNENNKSSTSRIDLNGYKKVNSNEERLENLGIGAKIGSASVVNKNMVMMRDNLPSDQMALKINLDEIKRKNENLKKKLELKETQFFYKLRNKLDKIVDSNIFVIFFMILTFLIMFITDVQNGYLTSETDNVIDALQITILVLFLFEIILTCLAKEGYTNTFFFWLDVVSTISIIQDIGFIFDPLLSITSDESDSDLFLFESTNTTDLGGNKGLRGVNLALGKITAVSRITRILRIIRVIRLIRIVKLYKNAMMARENIMKKRKEKQKQYKKNALLEASIANSANPVNNHDLALKNMGRRFSKSAMNPIIKDSVYPNYLNDDICNDNIEDIIDDNKNRPTERVYENHQERIVNNYVQITNIININQNNFDINSLPPKIEIEINTDFNGNIKAPSCLNRLRPIGTYRSSMTLTHKQLKLKTEEKKKTNGSAVSLENLKKQNNSFVYNTNKFKKDVSLENLLSESKTSKIVTESITKKVIILILSILVMLPILEDTFYANDDIISYNILSKYIASYFSLFSNNSDYLPPRLNYSLWEVILNEADENFPIVNITSYNTVLYTNSTWENYPFRKSELSTAISPDSGVIILYSLLFDNKIVALLNILKTIFLCILVTIATVYFENDVKNLVLEPLEVMIEIVEKVAKDPIKAKNLENLETGMKTTISKIKKEDDLNSSKIDGKKKLKRKAEDEYEVKIIQSAIMKISALLAIGIGEAGTEIIKENLSNYNDLDPMVKGRKKNAIFGFCNIRGFPQVNEILQEDTMVFLNQIADIVHSSIDLFGGSTNKNIGDTFLMVWKLPGELNNDRPHIDTKDNNRTSSHKLKLQEAPSKNSVNNLTQKHQEYNNLDRDIDIITSKNLLKLRENTYSKNETNKNFKSDKIKDSERISKTLPEVSKIADLAVFGFLRVIAKINRDLRILKYRQNEDIKKKIKDFKVNMGFGLHMGWAIEGAIGSSYKIDASYLSPNVNLAARLEAATRQYGVSILISGPLYKLLSNAVKKICRLIDVVTVKGSIKPIKFYTIDINQNFKPSKKLKKSISDKNSRIKLLHKKRQLKIEFEEIGVFDTLMKKRYFKQMLKYARPSIFNVVFKDGFEAYIGGDWELAGKKFDECLNFFENDGPTKTLLKFIKEHNFQAPNNWQGFRALTSK